jgi:cytochrome P450
MPYTQAVILEVQRYASILPLGVFHRTTEHVADFGGFTIPKDTIVIPNFYAAMRDPAVWTAPEEFLPDRFLAQDQHRLNVVVPEAFLPFGIGKRVCLGQSLARLELFLMVSCLLQKFQIGTVPNEPKPEIAYSTGLTLVLKPHSLLLTRRF